jgi:hypothetical protein
VVLEPVLVLMLAGAAAGATALSAPITANSTAIRLILSPLPVFDRAPPRARHRLNGCVL